MRYAALWPLILTVLCSGCAAQAPPAPVVVTASRCASPAPPELPVVDGGRALDHEANAAALLERDSRIRRYISGLRATIACYDAQAEGER